MAYYSDSQNFVQCEKGENVFKISFLHYGQIFDPERKYKQKTNL